MADFKINTLKITGTYVCIFLLLFIFALLWTRDSECQAGQRIRLERGVYSNVNKSLTHQHRKAMDDFYKQAVAALEKKHVVPTSGENCCDKNYFKVELLTSNIETDIRSISGSYPIEQKLGIKVVSSKPGWKMTIHSTPILPTTGRGKDKIRQDEICLLTDLSGYVSLHNPIVLVPNGPISENRFFFELGLLTKTFHRPGKYEGKLLIHITKPHFQNTGKCAPVCLPVIKVPFEVEVTSHCVNVISGNKIYFHVGDPITESTPMNGIVQGRLEADSPVSLNLKVEAGRIDQLPMIRSFFTERHRERPSIPLTWKLSEQGRCFRLPDAMANNRASWVVHGTPGVVDYKLDCSIAPTTHQDAGDYGSTITMTIKPLL